jgi:Zn-dependent protease with chaperone function
MKVTLTVAALVSISLLPAVLRTSLYAGGSPKVIAWFGVTSLLGIAACSVSLLAAIVSPGPLPLVDLPRAVGICFDAVSRLLANPLHHWPSIVAAVLLVGVVARVIVVGALVARDSRRARPPRQRFPGEEEALRGYVGIAPSWLRLLPDEGSVAYTTGLVRPVTVVSEGLMSALATTERLAVIGHEQAHASRAHTALLSMTRVVARAFAFVPGIRVSAELLMTAVEARADVHATMMVGDPLVVARALTTSARLMSTRASAGAGISDGEIDYRIKQLTTHRRVRPGLVGVVALATIATFFAQGLAWSGGQRALTQGRLALTIHDTCHMQPAVS